MADRKVITLTNGKYGVNGKRVFGYRYKSAADGNWYQINSDWTRTFLDMQMVLQTLLQNQLVLIFAQ